MVIENLSAMFICLNIVFIFLLKIRQNLILFEENKKILIPKHEKCKIFTSLSRFLNITTLSKVVFHAVIIMLIRLINLL